MGDATSKHALVPRDGYTVPLIGIPPVSVLETCDLCGVELGLLDVEINAAGNQILCAKCRQQWSAPAIARAARTIDWSRLML